MHDQLNNMNQLLVWVLFFASSVYGHIAFKFVTGTHDTAFNLWNTLFSFWGISATLSWAASAILWILILAKNPLLTASTVSALSYALIVLAAVFLFKESLTTQHFIGVLLMMTGIYFVTQ